VGSGAFDFHYFDFDFDSLDLDVTAIEVEIDSCKEGLETFEAFETRRVLA
jgi:hypothetical protein